MQLLYTINRTGTTILMVTHDREMVDKMRRRVIALDKREARARRAARRLRVRMTAVPLVIAEALRSLGATSRPVAATMTVLIGMFLLGLFSRSAPGCCPGPTTSSASSRSRSSSSTT